MGYDYYIDGPIHQSDLLRPHAMQAPESLPVEFLRSAAYAGAQEPVSGVVQLVDKVAGSNLLPNVQFMHAPEKAEFGTVRWHTQQFGSMLGVTAGLLALHKGVGGASNGMFGRIEDNAANQGALALRTIGDSAATGFVHNGLFRPVSDEEGNFYGARFKNAMVGAGTYATLSASTLGIQYLGKEQQNLLGTVLRSNVGSTVISGVPGGFAYAEMKSLADGHGPASAKSIGQAVYSFSVLGGAFAAGKELVGSTHAEERLNELMKGASETARKPAEFEPTAKPPTIESTAKPPVLESPAKPPVLELPAKPPVLELPAKPPVLELPPKPPVSELPVKSPMVESPAKPPLLESPPAKPQAPELAKPVTPEPVH